MLLPSTRAGGRVHVLPLWPVELYFGPFLLARSGSDPAAVESLFACGREECGCLDLLLLPSILHPFSSMVSEVCVIHHTKLWGFDGGRWEPSAGPDPFPLGTV